MKKINLRIALGYLLLLAACITGQKVSAQDARLQVIHNASAISLDTVDVYINDVLYDNVAFRTATSSLSLPEGTYNININDRNSIDSGDMVLARFVVLLPADPTERSENILMIAGVDTPANYAANPGALSTELHLIHKQRAIIKPSVPSASFNIIHGSTDAGSLAFAIRPGQQLSAGINYGDTTDNIVADAGVCLIDVKDVTSGQVIYSYLAPFDSYEGKSLTLFTSGFMDAAANQNGSEFGLYLVDTNGGEAVRLAEGARLQIINNSPDTSVDKIDVWLNNTKVADSLAFRNATGMLSIESGTYDITVTRKNSADTSSNVLYREYGVTFETGKSYIKMAEGVLDTTKYAQNPGSINRRFTLISMNDFPETTSSDAVSLVFANGSPNAPAISVSLQNTTPTPLFANTAYNSVSSPAAVSPANLLVTSSLDNGMGKNFQFNLTGHGGKTGVLFTSGLVNQAGNPNSAQPIYYYIVLTDGTFIPVFVYGANSRLQLIHNAAASAFDTVDVYMNGTKLNNLAFRTATNLLSIPSGNYLINVNNRNSIDSGDMVLARFTATIAAGSVNMMMLSGVDNEANYAANPDGRTTALRLIHRKGLLTGSTNNVVALTVVHGASDAAGFDISTRPAPSAFTVNNIRYGDTTTTLFPQPVQTLIDLKDTTGNTIIKSYIAPFNLYARKALVVFASGFLDPSTNQNGASVGLYAVDTNGGNAVAFQEGARIQFINNSPDVTLDSVAVWLNTTRISKLAFRQASALQSVASGTYDITVTKKNSADTSGSNVLYRLSGQMLQTGLTYIGITTGVIDTALYHTNPSGIDRSFALNMYDNYSEVASSPTTVNVAYLHGVPDAPAFSVDRNPAAPAAVFPETSFRSALVSANLPSTPTQVILEKTGTEVNKSYRLNLQAQAGKGAILFASGFYDTLGNESGSKLYQYYLATVEGTVLNVPELSANIQLIHACADTNARSLDVYINGTKSIAGFNFRNATPFMPLTAYKSYSIAVAPENSNSVSDAFYTTTLQPDSSKYYYAIATGLLSQTGYAVNPDNVNTAFSIALFANGKLTSSYSSKNVDLLYFHGITDAPATTSIGTYKGVSMNLFLSKNDLYKEFHGYTPHPAYEAILFPVYDAVTNKLLFDGIGDISLHEGKTGVVFAAGFLNPSINKNGDSAMMFVAWASGQVDTLHYSSNPVGVKENELTAGSVKYYPNPVKDQLTVALSVKSERKITAGLYDLTGKMVLQSAQLFVPGANEMKLDVSGLNSGLYILQITSGTETVSTKISVTR